MLQIRRPWFPYVAVGLLSTFFMLVALSPISLFSLAVVPGGGDTLYFQAVIESAGRTGPFAGDTHLNWPLTTNSWSHPQSGFLILSLSFIFIKVFGFSSFGAFQVIFMLSGVLAALGIMYFLRSVSRSFVAIAIVLSLALSVGPFTLLKAGHLNVASFYVLPVALSVVLRMYAPAGRRRKMIALLILAACAAAAPIWWTTVIVMILIALIPAGIAIGPKRNIRAYLPPLLSTLVGFSFPVAMALLETVPGSTQTRGAWDSNVLGGHLTDFFLASPFINAQTSRLTPIVEGSSAEPSLVGIVGAILAGGALLSLLLGPRLALVSPPVRILFVSTLITFLLFLLGGFGNLQAGLAVLFQITSPARVWARLSILLAVLGAAWLLRLLLWAKDRYENRWRMIFRLSYTLICLLLTVLWGLDYMTITHKATQPVLTGVAPTTFAEYGAVEFIKQRLSPCPVAQVPADSTPVPLSGGPLTAESVNDFYYRGYVSYLLAPEFSWSFGDTSPPLHRAPTATIPSVFDDAQLISLSDAGYCAVLYDKALSKRSVQLESMLPGDTREVSYPADFSSDRFDVYLLP